MSTNELIPYLPKLIGKDAPSDEKQQFEDQALDEQHDLSLPVALREWHEGDGVQLIHLAKAIDKPQGGADPVHSIPDPWARALLFKRALLNDDHSLHATVMGEWRGLLAMLALKEVRRLSELSVRAVSLSPGKGIPESFTFAVSRVLPDNHDAAAPSASWKSFDVLRWTVAKDEGKSRAFAMTSPWTLVATGADYARVLSTDEVPWFNGKFLTDPRGQLSKYESDRLAEWLLHVRDALPVESPTTAQQRVTKQKLTKQLKAFAESLSRDANGSESETTLFSNRSLPLSGGPLYATIRKPIRPTAEVVTNCALRTDQPGAPLHVLIDPSVVYSLGRQERDVAVYRTVSMATRQRLIPELARGYSGMFPSVDGQPDVHWCTADFFFEPELIYIHSRSLGGDAGPNAFPGCRTLRTEGRSEGRHCALPIRKGVLKLFSPDYLEKHLSLEWSDNGEAKFVLRLEIQTLTEGAKPDAGAVLPGQALETQTRTEGATPVNPPTPSGTTHFVELERVYNAESMMRVAPKLPIICLWPNFSFPDEPATVSGGPTNRWSRYYLFESWRGLGDKAGDFKVNPLDEVNDSLPWKVPEIDQAGQQQGEESFRITLMQRYPKALVCTMSPRQGSASGPTGLLLPRPAVPGSRSHTQSAALGVDFGTTGTSIYRSLGSQDPGSDAPLQVDRVRFKQNRLVEITVSDSGTLQRVTRELFLPRAEQDGGRILSIFQDFGVRGGTREAVRDGHVLFTESTGAKDLVYGDPQSIYTDLKWSEDRKVNDAAKDFLFQLCLQSLAELVAEGVETVHLRYSYPTAFSEGDLDNFKALWGGVLTRLEKVTSTKLAKIEYLAENCEAIAATRYFSRPDSEYVMNVDRGALTLDIGGGTTDIAVWNRHPKTSKASLLAHTSIKFAGRDMFLAPLRHRPDLLAFIDDGGAVTRAVARLKERFADNMSARDAELDGIISNYGDELLSKLPSVAQSKGVKELLQILNIGLCGLGFYSGLIIGRLVRSGNYDPNLTKLPVFVGGNGSRLFDWCALGNVDRDSMVARRFGAALLNGANYACGDQMKGVGVELWPSHDRKHEVAWGLVMRPERLERSDEYRNPMAGECYFVGQADQRQSREWSTAPDETTLGTQPVLVDQHMPVFRHFLESVDVHLDDEGIDRLASHVDRAIRNIADLAKVAVQNREKSDGTGGTRDRVRKLPFFVMALRALLDDRIKQLNQIRLE